MALRRAVVIAALFVAAWVVPAAALEPLPVPSNDVVLTVAGKIAVHNTADDQAAFDLAMLETLPKTTFETNTIWTDGKQRFEGVKIADLLARLGSDAAEIQATASNDYEIRFPVSDATKHGGIIAYRLNGAPLPVNNKGPLWIVYPYDHDTALNSERFQGESVWSLETLMLH